MKGTIATRHHSTLVVNVSQGPLDVIGNIYARDKSPKPTHIQVNPYWISDHYTGEVCEFLTELLQAMKDTDWHDRTDIQTDYFDISWYTDINIGKWDKPYILTA